jgi:glycosyltransferase involved in cell wall biosynthesis
MDLTLDLRSPRPAPPPQSRGEQWVGLRELAGLARAPRTLRSLTHTQWHRVTVVEDPLPMSFPQAAAGSVAPLLRAQRRTVSGPDGERELSRSGLARHALRRCADAAMAEVGATWRLTRRARAFAAHRGPPLPRRAGRPESVLYVRTEPSTTWAGTSIGGAAAHTTGVINGLADTGLGVHVVAADAPRDVRATSITQVRPSRNHHLVAWLGATNESEEIAGAAFPRADFVYQRHALGGYVGLVLARRWGVPLVLEYNGSEVWSSRHWSAHRQALMKLAAQLERRVLADASVVVVVSEVLRQELLASGIGADRIVVNPNGVDPAALEAFRAETAPAWRRRLGLPERPTVGFIGTFGPWHGVTDLPAIAAAVAAEVPDAHWLLIGDGALHEPVRQRVGALGLGDVVTMTGIEEHDRALQLLAAADVCVSPHVPNPDGTRFFGSPIKLFEYMGLRKPIVAADLEQIGEVLVHDRTGLLVPPRDTGAFARAIVRLLREPSLADRLAAAALEEVQAHYTWRAHAARTLSAVTQRAADGAPANQ